MQLKPAHLRRALTAATCSLLGAPAAQADSEWSFDSAMLMYSETGRVSATEPTVAARWDLGDEQWMNFRFTYDSLTGASANGAAPATVFQTFTNPSGGGRYGIDPGKAPLDPTFKDTRYAFNYAWELPITRLDRLDLGANLSTEHDYGSIALNANWAHDFNLKNTTVSGGISLGHDTVAAVGGNPLPLTVMSQPWRMREPIFPGNAPPPPRLGDQTKDLVDLLFGVTQVLSPQSLVQLNYSWGSAKGYLTDPYKLVSVVDGAAGPDQGNPTTYLYEGRPDARTKQALYAMYKRMNDGGDSWDASYRYMWDDWAIKSHTFEAHYRWMLGAHDYLQPHLRMYQQSAADFYTPYLIAGAPLPAYASGDYRLGAMDTDTIGIKYGHDFGGGQEVGVHLEYYQQTGDHHPAGAIGVLQSLDLFPTVEAVMIQVDYSFQL